VIDAKTGNVVFDKNSQVGLAPASTQKIITSATAFELLGKDYRYKTELGYDGKIQNEVLNGNVYVIGSGDPTLGSWRWKQTNDSLTLAKWLGEIRKKKINNIRGVVTTNQSKYSHQAIPGGWIWDDIGNYYGAGAYQLNWKENQYKLKLKSGDRIGDSVYVINDSINDYVNELKTAAKGTGDNAYVYFGTAPNRHSLLKGTIPLGEKSFSISGALADPVSKLITDLEFLLDPNTSWVDYYLGRDLIDKDSKELKEVSIFYTQYSPSLDSIIYWFLKKSINLYGEALVKTFAYEKQGFGSTDSGVAIVKDFWKQKGMDEDELNICDRSGLSPLNRVTTHSQVEILRYAKTKDWFPWFYDALPEFNGMKMKSGTIRDVKAFCGYQTAKDGNEYIFSFIVNNYNGRTSDVVNKMYKVLDCLK
jgi:serine-type D-Ala-D-Ala carboxypeptidase/endopeptidase (penicillin-binding protein 4)